MAEYCSMFVVSGRHRNVLIVSAEISSCGMDWQNPKVCTLFGDAAAAAVVRYFSI